MSPPLVVVHHDADVLAEAVAARLITRIADVQAARLGASVVLTGGGVGTATLAAVAVTRAGRRGLGTAGRLVGRRTVPPDRRRRTQRDPGAHRAARPCPGRPRSGPPDARIRQPTSAETRMPRRSSTPPR